MRFAVCAAALIYLVLVTTLARADEPSLALIVGDATHRYTASELLARPDAANVHIPDDVDYHRATD